MHPCMHGCIQSSVSRGTNTPQRVIPPRGLPHRSGGGYGEVVAPLRARTPSCVFNFLGGYSTAPFVFCMSGVVRSVCGNLCVYVATCVATCVWQLVACVLRLRVGVVIIGYYHHHHHQGFLFKEPPRAEMGQCKREAPYHVPGHHQTQTG